MYILHSGGGYDYSEEDIKCTFCGKVFATPGSKTRHVVTVHQKVEPHQCDICLRFYKNKNSLSAHRASHKWFRNIWSVKANVEIKKFSIINTSFILGFSCQYCGKVLATKWSWQVHIKDMHESSSETFTCKFCEKVFKSRNTLSNHKSLYHKGFK